jgi:hypothetical protein
VSSHEDNKPRSDDWHTPPEIIAALPEFDLDPCASNRQTTRTARRMIHWPTNGLFETWGGTIWLNPPWGARTIDPWMERMAAHNNGVALVPARIDTGWFHRFVWSHASGMFAFRGRLTFLLPMAISPSAIHQNNAAAPCVLVSYGELCREWLRACRLSGAFVELTPRTETLPLFAPILEAIG